MRVVQQVTGVVSLVVVTPPIPYNPQVLNVSILIIRLFVWEGTGEGQAPPIPYNVSFELRRDLGPGTPPRHQGSSLDVRGDLIALRHQTSAAGSPSGLHHSQGEDAGYSPPHRSPYRPSLQSKKAYIIRHT